MRRLTAVEINRKRKSKGKKNDTAQGKTHQLITERIGKI